MIWATLAIALLLSFLLSGLESAVLAVSSVRLRHRAKGKERASGELAHLFQDRERLLSAVLLANNSVNLLVFAFLTKMLVDHMGNIGYVTALFVSLPIYVLGLELVPKSIFKRFPYRSLSRFLPLLKLAFYGFGPLIALQRLLPDKWRRRQQTGADGREEFRSLADIIEREGKLTSQENTLIQNVLDFHRVTVREAMIPLSRVTAVPLEMPILAVLELARETRLEQFPVMSAEGQLVGLVNTFEVFRDRNPSGTAVRYLRRLVRTRPNEKATTIIQRLRRSGIQLAAVYSERGRPLGIVSAEDLVHQMLNRS